MNRTLIVIGIQEENLLFLRRQLDAVFMGQLEINMITLKDLDYKSIGENNVVLLTGKSIVEIVKPFLSESNICIVANRTVNIVNMKELLYIKRSANILVVNDNDYDTLQTTESIKAFLPQHNYSSYIRNKQIPMDIDLVVTPGETQLIPSGLPRVIDIGTRVISIDTLLEIIKVFGVDINREILTQLYIKSMVNLSEEKLSPQTFSFDDKNLNRTFDELNTNSALLQSTIQIAKKLAKTKNIIHIEGEIGTGKRMLAEMIHNHSMLSASPIYVYNCSDKEIETIQRELFSHDSGLINSVSVGTIFIRNIDSLPYSLQGDLVNVIENHSKENTCLITSSTTNLETLLSDGALRLEIYMHLSSYTLRTLKLTERKEDIKQLITDFKRKLNRLDMQFSDEVMEAFNQYSWPGNVRELFNVVSYCVCLDTDFIELESLPIFFKGNHTQYIEEVDNSSIIEKIEEHGFLDESIHILDVLYEGKKQNLSFGRMKMKSLLLEKSCTLTDQQLRLRMDVLRNLGLINVRRGRAGTTITRKGEEFLHNMKH